ESGELLEESVVSKMETTDSDGKRYNINYYNLDAIIAVGYRVNSRKATMFRIWANRILKEFIIKGYVMDDERQARRGNVMYMRDWVERLDAFLQFNEEDILHDKGKVTAGIILPIMP
ncbi:MAG: RhuM family protein, partial [Erysipelotrichaceae bacterium]|nr:RhuM family protein [Erysipelotrichaceae bacterium]